MIFGIVVNLCVSDGNWDNRMDEPRSVDVEWASGNSKGVPIFFGARQNE